MSTSRMMKSTRTGIKENKKDRFYEEYTEVEKLIELAGNYFMMENEFRSYSLLSPYNNVGQRGRL